MNRITTICDACKVEQERPKGWIEAGGWMKGHSIDRIEIYLNFMPDPPNDPDEHYHFCRFACLVTFLQTIQEARLLQSANAVKSQPTNENEKSTDIKSDHV